MGNRGDALRHAARDIIPYGESRSRRCTIVYARGRSVIRAESTPSAWKLGLSGDAPFQATATIDNRLVNVALSGSPFSWKFFVFLWVLPFLAAGVDKPANLLCIQVARHWSPRKVG